jgi:hypothetical protein
VFEIKEKVRESTTVETILELSILQCRSSIGEPGLGVIPKEWKCQWS